MKKMTVTYHAPKGDSKVLEAFGRTFFDGKSEEVEVDDNMAEKMRGNRHLECSEPEDVDAHSTTNPEQKEAQDKAAEAADNAKREAQLQSIPHRGVHQDGETIPGETEPPHDPDEPPPPEEGEGETRSFRSQSEGAHQDRADR